MEHKVLTDHRQSSNILEVYLFKGANIDSNHKLNQHTGTKNTNNCTTFRRESDIESHYNACAEEIRNATSEVLGQQECTLWTMR
uniref:Uncharacterized protein n=1 Tax=Megaselia scalaris TaxID=36166 RepID=T1GJH1_MEGSC